MTNDFYLMNAKKLKNGAVHYRGLLTVVADFIDGDDGDGDGGGSGGGGGGGGGGTRKPPYKIEIPDLTLDVKWIYSDGTPGWAIAAAEAIGHETVHVQDLPKNYPYAN